MSGTTPCVSKPQRCEPRRPKPVWTSSAMHTPPAAAHLAVDACRGNRREARSARRRWAALSARNAASAAPFGRHIVGRSRQRATRTSLPRCVIAAAVEALDSRPAEGRRAPRRDRPPPPGTVELVRADVHEGGRVAVIGVLERRRRRRGRCAPCASRKARSFASLPEFKKKQTRNGSGRDRGEAFGVAPDQHRADSACSC